MRLFEFETSNGMRVRVNPAQVVYVFPRNGDTTDPTDPAVIVMADGKEFTAKDPFDRFFVKYDWAARRRA